MVKTKILYVVPNLKRCGPINILYNLAKYIDKDNYEIYIVSLSPQVENTREDEFKNLGCKLYNLNLSKIKSIFCARRKVYKIAKENNVDIIHSHGLRPDIINSKIKNYKTISTLHNYPYDDYKMAYGKFIGYIASRYHVKILKNIDKVCACSKSIKDMMDNKGINIDYVKNGVDDKVFTPTSENEKYYLRKKLNLPISDRIFIVIGEFNIRKNLSLIIDCFKNRNNRDEKVVFIGNGKTYEQSVKQSKENPNIIFKGRVENVDEYLKASDYYISSSLAEGLPNSVLEAMSTGIPCILSNIPPHEEISNDKNQLFNPKDMKELSKTIDYVVSKDYQCLKKECILTIENTLSASKMVVNYEAKYESLLKI